MSEGGLVLTMWRLFAMAKSAVSAGGLEGNGSRRPEDLFKELEASASATVETAEDQKVNFSLSSADALRLDAFDWRVSRAGKGSRPMRRGEKALRLFHLGLSYVENRPAPGGTPSTAPAK